MIKQEIKIAVFALASCVLAAMATMAIYQHASGTTASAWLLVPLFSLIAIAIIASEWPLKAVQTKDYVQVSLITATWAPSLKPAMPGIVVLILSMPPAVPRLLPEARHDQEADIVVTTSDQCAEQRTCV